MPAGNNNVVVYSNSRERATSSVAVGRGRVAVAFNRKPGCFNCVFGLLAQTEREREREREEGGYVIRHRYAIA